MGKEKLYDAVATSRKIRDRMGPTHWKNPELFKMKLAAASKRFQEQLSRANPEH